MNKNPLDLNHISKKKLFNPSPMMGFSDQPYAIESLSHISQETKDKWKKALEQTGRKIKEGSGKLREEISQNTSNMGEIRTEGTMKYINTKYVLKNGKTPEEVVVFRASKNLPEETKTFYYYDQAQMVELLTNIQNGLAFPYSNLNVKVDFQPQYTGSNPSLNIRLSMQTKKAYAMTDDFYEKGRIEQEKGAIMSSYGLSYEEKLKKMQELDQKFELEQAKHYVFSYCNIQIYFEKSTLSHEQLLKVDYSYNYADRMMEFEANEFLTKVWRLTRDTIMQFVH